MKNQVLFSASQKRILFLSSLGGVLEYYDFIVYIFLAPYIEKIFFSDSSTYVATLKTLAIFSVGYLIRPLGGILFSHYGDRYGRKVTFLFTILLMALPSFAIGLLPTPDKIGMMSPILLLFFRLLQGLALGGEIPAAITFISEHLPSARRGFALATVFFGINVGLLLGSLVTTLLMSWLPESVILQYGFRIPFILGGFFGLISIFLRRYLPETESFKSLKQHDIIRIPIAYVLKNHLSQVIQGVFLISLGAVSIFFYLYWPQYLHQQMHYDFNSMMRLNTFSTLLLNIMILLGGYLADRIGYRKVYLYTSITIAILSYPLFMLFNMQSLTYVVISYVIFTSLFGFIPSVYSAILCDFFPTRARYSGIAFCYNIAYAIFGGLSPIICTLLIHQMNTVLAPAYYIILIAVCAASVCYFGRHIQGSPSFDKTLQSSELS